MGRRSDHSREELRELIVKATLEMVRDRGADNVTARQIAKAVGYTPGMLYSLFDNLQDIFLHVNQQGLRALYSICVETSNKNQTPDETILELSLAYVNFAANHVHQFDLMFKRDIQHPQFSTPHLGAQIRLLFELVETQLRRVNPTATQSEVQLGARALWSGVHGTAALRLSNQLYFDSPQADRQIVAILVTSFIKHWTAS